MILKDTAIPSDAIELLNTNIAHPIYKYDFIEASPHSTLRLYQNVGHAKDAIGTIITSIFWDGSSQYTISDIEFISK